MLGVRPHLRHRAPLRLPAHPLGRARPAGGGAGQDFFGFLPFGFFIALTLLPILSGQITDANRQVADTLVGYVFVALPMAYIVLVKSAEPYGLEFLVVVTVAVALSDIAAYATGSALRAAS